MNKKDEKHAEETAFERAVRAAKSHIAGRAATLDPREQEMLLTFPEEDRLAAIVFVRWCESKKFKDGIRAKLMAKTSFIEAWRIFSAIFLVDECKKKIKI